MGDEYEGPYRVRHGDVVDKDGAIVYDWLDSIEQANDLCDLMNLGVAPEWDVLGVAYRELIARRKRGKKSRNAAKP